MPLGRLRAVLAALTQSTGRLCAWVPPRLRALAKGLRIATAWLWARWLMIHASYVLPCWWTVSLTVPLPYAARMAARKLHGTRIDLGFRSVTGAPIEIRKLYAESIRLTVPIIERDPETGRRGKFMPHDCLSRPDRSASIDTALSADLTAMEYIPAPKQRSVMQFARPGYVARTDKAPAAYRGTVAVDLRVTRYDLWRYIMERREASCP